MDELSEIRTTQRDNNIQIAKLWTTHRELATVVWGDNITRDNGLRSRVDSLEASRQESARDRSEMRESLRHYLDVERRDTCHGILALAEHEKEYFQKVEDSTNLKIAKIQAGAQTKGAKIAAASSIIMQLIIAAGVFYSILIK